MRRHRASAVFVLILLAAGLFEPVLGQQLGGGLGQAQAPSTLPDFIKPGARLLYESGSSSEGKSPSDKGSAGVGVTRYDVIAIGGDTALVAIWNYLAGFNNPAAITYIGGSSAVVDANTARSGAALWMPVATLNSFQSGQGIEVNPGTYQLGNQSRPTKVITIKTNNAIERMQFDTGSGLKVTQQNATGSQRRSGGSNPFNLQHQSYQLFKGFRQVNLPWLGFSPPNWISTVNRLSYQGNYITTLPGAPPISVPLSLSIAITNRGPDWLMGNITHNNQGQAAASAPFISAQASIGGIWMSPAALQRLNVGVIDRDVTLGSTLSFTRDSTVGVLSETGDLGGYKLQWTYRLSDGVLLGLRSEDPGLNLVTEYQLSGIQ